MSSHHHTHNTTPEHFQVPINTLAAAVVVAAAAGSELKGMMGNELLARGLTDFNGGNPRKRPCMWPPSKSILWRMAGETGATRPSGGRTAPDHPQIYL